MKKKFFIKIIIVFCGFFLIMILIPLLAVWKSKDKFTVLANSNNLLFGEDYSNASEDYKYFRVLDESDGKIKNIPEKEFLYSIVSIEMPANFEIEALKAQAVASYTYFCRIRNSKSEKKNKENEYDFTIDSQRCNNYMSIEKMKDKWGQKFDSCYKKIKDAVDSVYGEVIEDDGELILAAYHAISSGKTEKSADVFGGDLKYLTNVESPGDKLVSGYKSEVGIDVEKFKQIISEKFNDCKFVGNPSDWIGNVSRTEGGMVKEINICSKNFKGIEIRKLFSLRSSDFELTFDENENKFIFKVIGYGHGVGMSQYGAQYMALNGSSYKEILNWYYPNAIVSTRFK